jgi:hypothetical protein
MALAMLFQSQAGLTKKSTLHQHSTFWHACLCSWFLLAWYEVILYIIIL